jgi:hypothetical protein
MSPLSMLPSRTTLQNKEQPTVPIRFSNTPQLSYGRQTTNPWNRFPAHAQTITSAPQLGSQPVKIFNPKGEARWALYHLGAWRGLSPQKDFKTGSVQWRMDGSTIQQPVCWASS